MDQINTNSGIDQYIKHILDSSTGKVYYIDSKNDGLIRYYYKDNKEIKTYITTYPDKMSRYIEREYTQFQD